MRPTVAFIEKSWFAQAQRPYLTEVKTLGIWVYHTHLTHPLRWSSILIRFTFYKGYPLMWVSFFKFAFKGGDPAAPSGTTTLLRLHPPYQPYLRDLLPERVSSATSGIINSGDVTGGVYKARERIHRIMADMRLLAIPTSWSRVADSNPNWGRFFEISSSLRYCDSLCRPL